MNDRKLRCISCGKEKHQLDGFPNPTYAECWECSWADHIRKEHPNIVKRIRKTALARWRKQVEHITDADLIEHTVGTDRLVMQKGTERG